MKRMLAVGVLAAVMAVTAQGQNSGLTAQGSNFTGPGGGGGGATSTVGAFLPSVGATGGGFTGGVPSTVAGFATATAPANVSVGNISVTVSAAAQQAVGTAIAGNTASFVTSLGSVPAAQAQALGGALAALGSQVTVVSLGNAIAAFNAAVAALPAGAPVPQSLIAARAAIGAYYGS